MIPKHPRFGPGRRGYHHGGLKDALVEAARALMAEHGPAGFTLAEAAKRVGVTTAAPYRHFADRRDLMGELARRGFDLFAERLTGAWDEGRPDPRSAFRRMGRAYLSFAAAEPGLYSAMFDSAKNLHSLASLDIANRAFEGLNRAAAGVLVAAGGNPHDVRRLSLEIWALAHGTAMLALAGHLDSARGDDPGAILEHGTEALIETALRRK
ncbi:MAG TPA: TetR/AcrR family transcriptional regulator [Methylovirgula sp.]|nr:TetR/AcrR family transcriptional regulator [Methylovirgula sp.]